MPTPVVRTIIGFIEPYGYIERPVLDHGMVAIDNACCCNICWGMSGVLTPIGGFGTAGYTPWPDGCDTRCDICCGGSGYSISFGFTSLCMNIFWSSGFITACGGMPSGAGTFAQAFLDLSNLASATATYAQANCGPRGDEPPFVDCGGCPACPGSVAVPFFELLIPTRSIGFQVFGASDGNYYVIPSLSVDAQGQWCLCAGEGGIGLYPCYQSGPGWIITGFVAANLGPTILGHSFTVSFDWVESHFGVGARHQLTYDLTFAL